MWFPILFNIVVTLFSCICTYAKYHKFHLECQIDGSVTSFSHIKTVDMVSISCTKVMGTLKNVEITETVIGVVRFKMLRKKVGGWYYICHYVL